MVREQPVVSREAWRKPMAGIGRREVLRAIGGATVAWPVTARAQQRVPVKRMGVLLPYTADDAEAQTRLGAFLQELQQGGWIIGRNIRIDVRWAGGKRDDIRRHATELAALSPDVILAQGGSTVGRLLQTTRTVPIVFPGIVDPVGAGFVDSLAHPGGNATGFMIYEYSLSVKWLELLKQIAPSVTRVAVFRDATQGSGNSQFAVIQGAAPLLRMEVQPVNIRDADEIERTIISFAHDPNGGMIVATGPGVNAYRDLIINLAARHKLPGVYPDRYFSGVGGLMSYGPDFIDQYRRAAGYVDRILKGEKPGDLPVQAPTKYELVINMKTAKALGIDIPATLLARADEVIE
jgi:putative tryptophan/tyrosine transport system substrate-binding protein